ncbi:antitoxin [Streptomyces sp. SCSIO 75703]|uniref:antitoxin n=1 Tax=Streptomyces sp. SCSIO 75703 TaxID=3112165 RepID=UPI0030CB2240
MFDALKNLKDKDALKNLKEKAEEVAGTHGDKISDGLEKVGEFVDGKTRGKHSDKIDTAVDKAQDFVGKLGDKDEKGDKDGKDEKKS